VESYSYTPANIGNYCQYPHTLNINTPANITSYCQYCTVKREYCFTTVKLEYFQLLLLGILCRRQGNSCHICVCSCLKMIYLFLEKMLNWCSSILLNWRWRCPAGVGVVRRGGWEQGGRRHGGDHRSLFMVCIIISVAVTSSTLAGKRSNTPPVPLSNFGLWCFYVMNLWSEIKCRVWAKSFQ
jgi:hypothetical protein